MLNRQAQMEVWSSDFATPISVWLPGLFNPMGYVTACLQVTARFKALPLDTMASHEEMRAAVLDLAAKKLQGSTHPVVQSLLAAATRTAT